MAHIGENPYTVGSEKYESRAPYLICAICYELSNLDSEYRSAKGEAAATAWEGLSLPMSHDFPLSARFSSAAAFSLASSLVANENAELSKDLYIRYNQSVNDIIAELPATATSTVNVYPE